MKFILLVSLLSLSGMALSSCNNSNNNVDKNSKEYSSTYICPMHCEGSGSDEMGKCPECGMDYVLNEKGTKEAKTHEHSDNH